MDSLQAIISDIRVFLYSGLQNLPLSIAGTFLLIGLFTANYAMLFFLVGLLVSVPFVNFFLDQLLLLILPDSIRSKSSDVCRIVVPFLTDSSESYHIISQWTAMVSFFFGYMIHNSVKLLTKDPEPATTIELTDKDLKEINQKASYRKTQAIVSMISIVIVTSITLIMRYRTGCENIIGFLIGTVGYGTAGYFWYVLLSIIGEDRLSDLFGVANRLLPPSAIVNRPVACLPVPASQLPKN
jgi:uncharacterized membrane protein